MQTIADNFSVVAVIVVAVVLLLGLGNMLRAGSASKSQTLMRWRVGLQFAAVCVLMFAYWLSQGV